MKKLLLYLILASLVIPVVGCPVTQQESEPSQRITSFLGVSLGMTKAQVAAVLGNPIYTGTTKYTYYYDGTDVHVVEYDSNETAIWISTTSPDFSLEGVGVDDTANDVRSVLGNPDTTEPDTAFYKWYFNTYGIGLYFLTSNDTCYQIGIYSGDF